MRRRVFKIASALCLMLCGGLVALWLRSLSHQCGIEMPFGSEWGGGVVASRGSLFAFAFHFQGYYRVEELQFANDAIELVQEIGGFHTLAGFAVRWEPAFIYAVGVPIWLPLLIVILVYFLSRRVRGKPSASTCVRCGYSLTGNTSGTCPECGEPVASSAATPEPNNPRPA